MENEQFIPVIPSSGSVAPGHRLNVLGGMVNGTKEQREVAVALWGRAEDEWRCLDRRLFTLEPEEHKHLYFSIPAGCTEPAFWGLESLCEIELVTALEEPDQAVRGVLVFVE